MHEVMARGILSAQNGMNLYRGCSHGCIYCDARSRCYGMQHAFEDIEVKRNAVALLDDALRRKRQPCVVGTGAMSDPYMPLEMRLELMRQCLQVIGKHGCGVALQTKSDRVLRDLDLLTALHEKTRCVVQITLTTLDDDLCSKVEPHVAVTSRRYEVLKALQERGIPTVVWLSPLLPWINDTEANVQGILEYCVDAGVYGVINFGMGLTLRQGNREYYYRQLDRHFPGLKQRYIKTYGTAYAVNSPRQEQLYHKYKDLCEQYGMETRFEAIQQWMRTMPVRTEQLSLLDMGL